MPSNLPTLYLASESPRRRQLLEALGLSFKVVKPSANEEHPSAKQVEEITIKNAYTKASSALDTLESSHDIVVGADTLVVLNEEVLGKPKDEQGVIEMISKLSGKTHLVVTGLVLISPKAGVRKIAVKSHVTFHKLSSEQIHSYAKTKEPRDKAGSYAVQGLSALFIEKIDGSYTNVMGLPIEALLSELPQLTGISIFEFFQ